ncbi:hypothetical protein [Paenibacillus herberti]|uniref:hypothetical protein n=1 Tax=Paenibacillus herberti TaxID=1619309 RepID=UPI00159620A2|nr:hypothetical protein [Paenibacillus herberti]
MKNNYSAKMAGLVLLSAIVAAGNYKNSTSTNDVDANAAAKDAVDKRSAAVSQLKT